MKKIFLIILLLITNYSLLIAQSGWVEYSTGANKVINNIYFVNANTGWAVGDSTIVKSTDGGQSWIRQSFYYFGMPAYFNTVRFLNENTGYAAGGHHTGYYDFYYQYIFKTTNGGLNWNLLFNLQGSSNCVITKIFPVDENTIYISAAGIWMDAAYGGIYKSTNGGYNFSLCVSKGECNSLYFINASTGWANSYFWTDYPGEKGYILKTTNGGTNWIEQYKDSLFNVTKINSIHFINQNTGFAVGQKSFNRTKFFKTTNGGTSWDTVLFNHGKSKSLFFTDQSTGWIGGYAGPDTSCISFTNDGGLNWISQKKHYPGIMSSLYFINSMTGWATMNSSNILKTTNGGVTFISAITGKIPESYSLGQNYPNPFNPITKIKLEIPAENKFPLSKGGEGVVSLKVFDITGREIQTLINEQLPPGTYEVTFDARLGGSSSLPSGVYFYQLRTDEFVDTRKLVLLK